MDNLDQTAPGGLDGPESDLIAVREHAGRARIEAWALVLTALFIPHRIRRQDVTGDGHVGFVLLVSPQDMDKAVAALDASDAEDAERAASPVVLPPDRGRSLAPLLVALVLTVLFAVTGPRGGERGARWFAAGSAHADAILAGDLPRVFTALTLHADGIHLLGNMVAGLVFLGAISRWLGGGLAVLLSVLAGAVGNGLTALHHGGNHNSVGASTAMFAALGILGGLQFVFRARHGWGPRRRLGRAWPVLAACLGLFAMLGVGGVRVDVVAHAAGLGTGIVVGASMAFVHPVSARADRVWGLLSAGVVTVSWLLVLG